MNASEKLQSIQTDQAPKAIGPYSQGVKAGKYLFVSGQLGVDPLTGKLVGTTVEEQTRQVLKNLEAILKASHLTFENVVKCDVFMTDLNEFATLNKIYGETFVYSVKPARATIQVSKLPLGGCVEIACVAFIP